MVRRCCWELIFLSLSYKLFLHNDTFKGGQLLIVFSLNTKESGFQLQQKQPRC